MSQSNRSGAKSAVRIHSGERTGVSRVQTSYSVAVPAVEDASARQCELQPLLACRLLPWTRSRGTPAQAPSAQWFGSRSVASTWWHVHRPSTVLLQLHDVRESREPRPRCASHCSLWASRCHSDCQRVSNPQPSQPCDGCALPKGIGTPGVGRDLARSERIYRTPATNATMNCGVLRLIARRRRCRVIRACAMDTHDGEIPKATSDLRSWKGTQIYAHGVYARGTTNLVRNAVRRGVLGDHTIRQRVRRRQLELLALLVSGVTPLAYQRPQVGDGMQAQVL
jgi:hypothetical protein